MLPFDIILLSVCTIALITLIIILLIPIGSPRPKRLSICAECVYYKVEEWKLCLHPSHVNQSYITGVKRPGKCIDYNDFGQCTKFTPKETTQK